MLAILLFFEARPDGQVVVALDSIGHNERETEIKRKRQWRDMDVVQCVIDRGQRAAVEFVRVENHTRIQNSEKKTKNVF